MVWGLDLMQSTGSARVASLRLHCLVLDLEAHGTGSRKGWKSRKDQNKLELTGWAGAHEDMLSVSFLNPDLDVVGILQKRRPFIREAEG